MSDKPGEKQERSKDQVTKQQQKPHTRSIYIPLDKIEIFRRAEKLAKELNTNLNSALIEGLKLWVDKNENKYLSIKRDELIRTIREMKMRLHDISEDLEKTESLHKVIKSKENELKRIFAKLNFFEGEQRKKCMNVISEILGLIINDMPDLVIEEIFERDMHLEIQEQMAGDY